MVAVKVSNISRVTGKKHQNESVVTSQIAKSMLNVTAWPLSIIRLNVKSGVPQGSIMGPLRFNINDKFKSLYYLLMTLTTFSQMLKISYQLMANNLTINEKKTTLRAL